MYIITQKNAYQQQCQLNNYDIAKVQYSIPSFYIILSLSTHIDIIFPIIDKIFLNQNVLFIHDVTVEQVGRVCKIA